MAKERFCPNCGSTWVEPDTSNRAEVAYSGGDPNQWMCNECGYTGLMPEGDPEEDFDGDGEPDIEFEPNEDIERVDTGFGRGYLRYILYITIPILLLYLGIVLLTQ